MLELIEKLALALNNPFGVNLNISYETLMKSPLSFLDRYLKILGEAKDVQKRFKGINKA